ncbi:MAG: SGNH hydrolase [Actinobacteria bacterium]|nr:SGNH hydrolase [Actinomycetota bacterium]
MATSHLIAQMHRTRPRHHRSTATVSGMGLRACVTRGLRCTASAVTVCMVTAAPVAAMPDSQPSGPSRVAVWQGAMAGPQGTSPDATIRQLLMVSTDASSIRVRFSNHFGATPLTIRQAWAGLPVASSTARLVGDSNVRVTFDGRGTVTIPAGKHEWSDPIRIRVTAGDQVALSIYAPRAAITSKNFFAYAYAAPGMYISTPGNHAREESGRSFPALTVDDTDYPLQSVGYHPGQVWWTDVLTGRSNSRGTVVVIGDSVSDGWMAYGPPGQRWTDVLATRLNALPAGKRLSVTNAAISGNTVSNQQNPFEKDSACCGQPAVIRLWRDALSIPGVRAIILLEGTNDIGGGPFAPPSPPEQVIVAMQDIVDRAHARGIPVIGGTLIPMGKEPGSVQETSRRAVNAWIRSSGTFDAVIDFDRMVRDPQVPWQIYPAWQAPPFNGNYYHPNAIGHAVMGQQIPLGVFAVAR